MLLFTNERCNSYALKVYVSIWNKTYKNVEHNANKTKSSYLQCLQDSFLGNQLPHCRQCELGDLLWSGRTPEVNGNVCHSTRSTQPFSLTYSYKLFTQNFNVDTNAKERFLFKHASAVTLNKFVSKNCSS